MILGAKHLLHISWRGLGEYCDKPWLLHSAERVHLFGGVGGVDYNVPLMGLVDVMVYVWIKI